MQQAPMRRKVRRGATNSQVSIMSEPKKPNNAKLALMLGALVVFFFAMVFIKRIWL
jgi:hypothetical protein